MYLIVFGFEQTLPIDNTKHFGFCDIFEVFWKPRKRLNLGFFWKAIHFKAIRITYCKVVCSKFPLMTT